MPALTGTLAQNKDVFVSGTTNNLWGITANTAETVGWVVDPNRGEVQRLTGFGTTLANTVITTGLTAPRSCALSVDETILYVHQQNGVLLSINPTTGANAGQIGTTAAFSTDWRYMVNGGDGYLYMTSGDIKSIHRYNLNTNLGEVFLWMQYWIAGLAFSPGNTYLYTFVNSGGPNTNGVLVRVVMAQGRFEVVAGTGAGASTNGEAFLVSAFNNTGDIVIDSTGAYVYAGDGGSGGSARLAILNGGSVSRVNVGVGWTGGGGAGPRMWMLKSANKILATNASTQFGVIT